MWIASCPMCWAATVVAVPNDAVKPAYCGHCGERLLGGWDEVGGRG